jgi:aspartyl protease family protein
MFEIHDSAMPSSPAAAGLLLVATALGLIAVRDALLSNAADVAAPGVDLTTSMAPPLPVKSFLSASVEIRRSPDGHFWTDAQVSGVPVTFLLDTGASTVALTRSDARRIGVDLSTLKRDAEVRTAGGRVVASTVTLGKIDVGGVVVENVAAVVIEDGLEKSLLGMSFLNELSGWEVSPGTVTLRR